MSQCGFFMAVRQSSKNFCSLPMNSDKLFSNHQTLKANGNKPFLSIVTEEDNTVELFLDALVGSEFDNAKSYISKNFVKNFDLNELSDFFSNADRYDYLVKVEFSKAPKNCKTNSFLLKDKQTDQNSIIHLRLIKEPDGFGKWKIYGIDKE